MQPSNEQQTAINIVQNNSNLLMKAGAGTGKSTTLRLIAEHNPDKNFLCIVYNTANAKESNEHPDKPDNILYKTSHSLAYGKIVTPAMRKKLDFKKGGGSISYNDINENLFENNGIIPYDLPQADRRHAITYIRKAMINALQTYCLSDIFSLREFCQPLYESWFRDDFAYVADESGGVVKQARLKLNTEQQDKLTELTRQHWLKLIDENNAIGISHDVYLKLFALQKLSIQAVYDASTKSNFDVDVLCLDEAQDTSPVVLQIFNSFQQQKVVVGDAAQQLYAWRGAVNAMDKFAQLGYEVGKLTTSYRFNENVAAGANNVLQTMGMAYQLAGKSVRTDIDTTAYLHRSNAGAVRQIFALYEENPYAKIYTNANIEQVTSKMWHLLAVLNDKVPAFPDMSLKHIQTKADALEALELSPELKQIVQIAQLIDKQAGGLKQGLTMLKTKLLNKPDKAAIIVSTIHKAKGLEWDSVLIGDDLIPKLNALEIDDLNSDKALYYLGQFANSFDNMCVLYVAITRAKVSYNLPWYLQDLTVQKLQDAILFFNENPDFLKETA